MKRITLLWIWMATAVFGQETILDQPTLPSGSLNSPENVFALVDDNNAVPATTNKVALDDIAHLAHDVLRPTIPTTLTGDESYILAVDSVAVANTITVPANMHCMIVNVSDTSEDLVVITQGNANQTLAKGQYLYVTWSTTSGDHILGRHPDPTVDDTMSDISTNAVQNAIVKAYIDAAVPTVDSAMNGGSANPVENQVVKTYVDNRMLVRATDVVVTGSGNVTTDETNFSAAVTALNAAGSGTLWIDGQVRLNASHNFTAPISLRGITSDAAILVAGVNAAINWGSSWNAVTSGGGGVVFNATAAFDTTITSPNLSLNVGDWVAVWSSDAISGVDPHFSGGTQHPMEMHRIFRDDGADVYSLGDFIVDALTTSQTIRLIPILAQPNSDNRSDVIISDLKLRQLAGLSNVRLMDVRCLNGVTFRRIVWEETTVAGAPGYVLLNFCSNVLIDQCECEGTDDYDGSSGSQYAFELACVNGVSMQNCFVRKQRHFIDSTSSHNSGLARWGTPRNVSITGNVFMSEGTSVTSLAPVSTHPEGWGWVCKGNVFHVSDQKVNSCAWIRARNFDFSDNIVHGSGLNRGVIFYADDGKCTNNEFRKSYICVEVDSTGGSWDRLTCEGNRFVDCSGDTGCIKLEAGTDHRVIGNTFIDCANAGVQSLTGNVDILNNTFDGHSSTSYPAVILTNGANCNIAGNYFEDCLGGAVSVATGDSITFSRNTFMRAPNGTKTLPSVVFTGTGSSSSEDVTFMHNDWTECSAVCVDFQGGATVGLVFGDNQRFMHNVFDECGTTQTTTADSGTDFLTASSHGMSDGQPVRFTTTNTLPAPLAAGTTYYVVSSTTSTYKVEATVGGGAIDITTNGTGTHTLYSHPLVKFADDGTTTGHRFAGNEIHALTNSHSVNLGAVGSSAVKFVGNTADGYGANLIGLSGTNAATVESAQAADNWTD